MREASESCESETPLSTSLIDVVVVGEVLVLNVSVLQYNI